ncbi:hypothetical protein [Microbacterium kribbense]|uniref:hypothetical protein n=1 Tax=Microbacterium kribbense TaxID=433645 RepID=UPI0031D955D5
MPRSRRRRPDPRTADSFEQFVAGFTRTEVRRGSQWTVQPVSAAHAQKVYTCPGCGAPVEVGTPHLVIWRADGILGDAADLAGRRHWHTHCWRVF